MYNQMQMESGTRDGRIQGNEAGVPKTVGGFSNELAVHKHRGMYARSAERDRPSGLERGPGDGAGGCAGDEDRETDNFPLSRAAP